MIDASASDKDGKEKSRTVVMDKSKGEPVISVQGEEKKDGENQPEDPTKNEVNKDVKKEAEDAKPAGGKYGPLNFLAFNLLTLIHTTRILDLLKM